jgi:hypothetical protein
LRPRASHGDRTTSELESDLTRKECDDVPLSLSAVVTATGAGTLVVMTTGTRGANTGEGALTYTRARTVTRT